MNLSLPRRLIDLNGDGVAELVTTGAVTLPSGIRDGKSHHRRNLILISGKDGTVMGRPYLVEMCAELARLNITQRLELQFDCTMPDHSKHNSTKFRGNILELLDKQRSGKG